MSRTLTLRAKVNQDGKFIFEEPAKVAAWKTMARGMDVIVTLERGSKRRTLLQNSRYWVAYVPFVQECLSQKYDCEISRDQAHEAMCIAFIGHIVVEIGGEEIHLRKKSSVLSTEQFSKFTDEVERYIETEWRMNPALIQAPEDAA